MICSYLNVHFALKFNCTRTGRIDPLPKFDSFVYISFLISSSTQVWSECLIIIFAHKTWTTLLSFIAVRNLVIAEMWYNKPKHNKDFYENPGISKMYNHTFWKTSGITKNSITNVFDFLVGITKNCKKIVKKV